jgi:chromosome segregation ATPase
MSGGGKRALTGKMRLGSRAPVDPQVAQRELIAAEEQLHQLEQELEHNKQALAESSAAAEAAQAAHQAACLELEKLRMATNASTCKFQDLQRQLKEAQADMGVCAMFSLAYLVMRLHLVSPELCALQCALLA